MCCHYNGLDLSWNWNRGGHNVIAQHAICVPVYVFFECACVSVCVCVCVCVCVSVCVSVLARNLALSSRHPVPLLSRMVCQGALFLQLEPETLRGMEMDLCWCASLTTVFLCSPLRTRPLEHT